MPVFTKDIGISRTREYLRHSQGTAAALEKSLRWQKRLENPGFTFLPFFYAAPDSGNAFHVKTGIRNRFGHLFTGNLPIGDNAGLFLFQINFCPDTWQRIQCLFN